MAAAMTAATASMSRKPVSHTITVPGAGRVVMRRAAKDPSSGLSAYIVKDKDTNIGCNVSVSLKRKDRYIGIVLQGHKNTIVDMEFLPTPQDCPIFTLGTCDQDGVVFLWFLRLAKDNLGIDIGLRQLRKYSFYSLRKKKTAYYNRIRLAGTPERGTMVLVPNDGSNVRVISFHCEPSEDGEGPVPVIAPPPKVLQIEGPSAEIKPSATGVENHDARGASSSASRSLPKKPPEDPMITPSHLPQNEASHMRSANNPRGVNGTAAAPTGISSKAGIAAGVAVAGAAVAGAAVVASGVALRDMEFSDDDDDNDKDFVAKSEESSSSEDDFDEEGVSVEAELDDSPAEMRDVRNSTFPLSNVENEGLLVDDDIAEATARAAGVSVTNVDEEEDYVGDDEQEEIVEGQYEREGDPVEDDQDVDDDSEHIEEEYIEEDGKSDDFDDDDSAEYEDASDGGDQYSDDSYKS